MKTSNTRLSAAALLLACGIWNVSAQTLTVAHTAAGALEAEITAALDGAEATTVTRLVITGETLDNTDATYLKTTFKTHLEELDITGVAFTGNNLTDKLCQQMTALKTVSLPDNLAKIGAYAFDNCANLETVNWGSVANIDNYAFQKCKKLQISELPENLTRIGQYGFSNCTAITVSRIPAGVTGFGERAFEFCTNLTITEIPENIAEIKERVFDRTGICEFTISNNVTKIGNLAFFTDKNPERTFTCRKETAPALGDRSFGAAANITNTKAKVLKAYADAYAAWATAGLTIEYLTQPIGITIESTGTVTVAGEGVASEITTITNGTTIEAYEGETVTFTVSPAATVKSGDTELTPDENTDGDYTVTIGDTPLALTFDFSISTGIEAAETRPVSGYIENGTLHIAGMPGATVTIYNCIGRRVLSTRSHVIDMSAFADGIYIVKTGNQTFKVIK